MTVYINQTCKPKSKQLYANNFGKARTKSFFLQTSRRSNNYPWETLDFDLCAFDVWGISIKTKITHPIDLKPTHLRTIKNRTNSLWGTMTSEQPDLWTDIFEQWPSFYDQLSLRTLISKVSSNKLTRTILTRGIFEQVSLNKLTFDAPCDD